MYSVTLPVEKAQRVELFGQLGLMSENSPKNEEKLGQVNIFEHHFEQMLAIINLSKSVYMELSSKYQTNLDYLMDTCLAIERYEDCLLLAKIKPDLTQKLLFVFFEHLFKILKESEG